MNVSYNPTTIYSSSEFPHRHGDIENAKKSFDPAKKKKKNSIMTRMKEWAGM